MKFKKIALAFCIVYLVIICSCTIENTLLEYTFENKSSSTIQITLFDSYETEVSSEEEIEVQVEVDGEIQTQTQTKTKTWTQTFSAATPFLIRRSEVKKVSICNNGIVDFQWTTNNAESNSKIYCETAGQKATFKNR